MFSLAKNPTATLAARLRNFHTTLAAALDSVEGRRLDPRAVELVSDKLESTRQTLAMAFGLGQPSDTENDFGRGPANEIADQVNLVANADAAVMR